jgi:hypothetical protein
MGSRSAKRHVPSRNGSETARMESHFEIPHPDACPVTSSAATWRIALSIKPGYRLGSRDDRLPPSQHAALCGWRGPSGGSTPGSGETPRDE